MKFMLNQLKGANKICLLKPLKQWIQYVMGMEELLKQGYNTKNVKKPCTITYFRRRLHTPKIDKDLLSFDKNGVINNTLHKSYSKSLYTFSDSMRLL